MCACVQIHVKVFVLYCSYLVGVIVIQYDPTEHLTETMTDREREERERETEEEIVRITEV